MKRVFGWILLTCVQIVPLAVAASQLPFIQDNFTKARAEALQRKLPIFVECWAPW